MRKHTVTRLAALWWVCWDMVGSFSIVRTGRRSFGRRSFGHSRLFATPSSLPTTTDQALLDFQRDIAALGVLRPADPAADTSAPVALISAGSSYTRLWTAATWKAHARPPHYRYWRHAWRWRFSTTARKVLPTTLLATLYAGAVSSLAHSYAPLARIIPSGGSSAVLTYLAAPLGLLLTLRTNQSMSRLLEARQAWGRLALHARSLANVAAVYLQPHNPPATLLLARHLATLGWILKSHLRAEGLESDEPVLRQMLDADSAEWLLQQPRRTTALTSRMRQIVAHICTHADDPLLAATLLVAEEKLASLEQVAGICERLSTSPIPPTYTRHLSRTIVLWLLFLPVSLVSVGLSTLGVLTVSSVATYVLCGVDEVGMEIENAFSLLPLQQMAAGVVTAVGQQFQPLPAIPS